MAEKPTDAVQPAATSPKVSLPLVAVTVVWLKCIENRTQSLVRNHDRKIAEQRIVDLRGRARSDPKKRRRHKQAGKEREDEEESQFRTRPTRLSSSRDRHVCFAMTRTGIPSRFQSEGRGDRVTRSQMRVCSKEAVRPGMGSEAAMLHSLDG
jgi:hypothetical protein